MPRGGQSVGYWPLKWEVPTRDENPKPCVFSVHIPLASRQNPLLHKPLNAALFSSLQGVVAVSSVLDTKGDIASQTVP